MTTGRENIDIGYQYMLTDGGPLVNKDDVYTTKCGAQSSGKARRHDLLPRSFTDRITDRFAMGAKKYPAFNYRKGLTDKDYIIERINHMKTHFDAFLSPSSDEEWTDDNIGAIGWCIAFLCECQETPEGRKAIEEIRKERSLHPPKSS